MQVREIAAFATKPQIACDLIAGALVESPSSTHASHIIQGKQMPNEDGTAPRPGPPARGYCSMNDQSA